MKVNKKSALLPIAAAATAIIDAVLCIIYGAMYEQYADWLVVVILIIGAALLVLYAVLTDNKSQWFSLIGTICIAWAIGQFLVTSLNVWQDVAGNVAQYGSLTGAFNFFGSQGGPVFPAIIIVLGLASAVVGIVTCFKEREVVAA